MVTTWIDTARKINDEHQAYQVDVNSPTHEICGDACSKQVKTKGRCGVILDGFTASMLVQIYDALNDKNKAKFDALPLLKAVSVGWGLTK